jgi:chromosome partitioning protein
LIITLTSHKGGVGKTTSAINLAAYLAERFGEGSTALVDTDPNESALDHAGRGVELTGRSGLPFRVVGLGQEVWEEHVVFDSQGRLHGEDLEEALEQSDLLVVPTMPDYSEIRALARFVGAVEEASERIKATRHVGRDGTVAARPAPYRVLLTMVPWWENRVYCPGQAELEEAGVPLFDARVESRRAFKQAAAAGVPVSGVKGRAAQAAWEEYRKVGEEMVAELAGAASGAGYGAASGGTSRGAVSR